jgi:hypothetical protein
MRAGDRPDERKVAMNPLRAFFVSFVVGLAVLFSGHGLVSLMLADAPDVPVPGAAIPQA